MASSFRHEVFNMTTPDMPPAPPAFNTETPPAPYIVNVGDIPPAPSVNGPYDPLMNFEAAKKVAALGQAQGEIYFPEFPPGLPVYKP